MSETIVEEEYYTESDIEKFNDVERYKQIHNVLITCLENKMPDMVLNMSRWNWIEIIAKMVSVKEAVNILEKSLDMPNYEYYPNFNCPKNYDIFDDLFTMIFNYSPSIKELYEKMSTTEFDESNEFKIDIIEDRIKLVEWYKSKIEKYNVD